MTERTREKLENELHIVLLIVGVIVTCLLIFLLWLGKRDDWGLLFWGYIWLFVAGLVIWLWNSVYVLEEDEELEVFFFGTHWNTYANGSLFGQLTEMDRDKYFALGIQEGHFGDWLFLPYGIFRVIRFSTGDLSVVLMARNILTAPPDENDPAKVAQFPRLDLKAKPEMSFRFLTIRQLVTTLQLPHHGDLTKTCDIPIFGTDNEKYRGTRLELFLAMKFQALVAEAIRKAGTYFNWEGRVYDIQKNKQYLEIISLFVLAQRGSNFEMAKILRRPSKGNLNQIADPTWEQFKSSGADVEDFWTQNMRSVDLNIDELIPIGSEEDPNGINNPYRAILAARERVNIAQAQLEEQAKAGEGRARALLSVIKAAKSEGVTDADTAYVLDVLRTREGDLSLNQFGGDVKSLIQELTPRRKKLDND